MLARALFSLLLFGSATGDAHAHGRPPSLNQLVFDPSDSTRLVAQATWGAVVSDDAGESWRWVCAAAMGVEPRNQDPRMTLASGGTLVVGTFDGLVRGEPDLCDFVRPEPALADGYVIDLTTVPGRPNEVLAVLTDSVAPDQLFFSDDGGASFTPRGPAIPRVLFERVRTGVDDPRWVYLSGAIPNGVEGGLAGFVYVSDDGGEGFDALPFALEGREWNVYLEAVDPTDASRLIVSVPTFEGEEVPERIVLSEDAGRTWETVARVPQVGGVSFSDDGSEVLVGSRIGGLYRSDDGGRTFDVVDPDLAVRCLSRRGDEVYLCADPTESREPLLRSLDGGERFEPLLGFDQLAATPTCARCSAVEVVCPAWFPDLAYDLSLDAAIPDGAIDPDAGTGLPRDVEVPPECADAYVGGLDSGDAGADAAPSSDGGGLRAVGGGGCAVGPTRHQGTLAPAALLIVPLVLMRRRARRSSDRR